MLVAQLMDTMRQGRRKLQIQSLRRWRHSSQDVANVFNEAQVEHTIGLIKHHNLDGFQIKDTLLK